MKLVLKARLNFANVITEGKTYPVVCQTKTGFAIIGDDGNQIDLYIHFFEIGIDNGYVIEWIPQRDPKNQQSVKTEEAQKEEAPTKELEKDVEDDFEEFTDIPVETIPEPENKVKIPEIKVELNSEDDDF